MRSIFAFARRGGHGRAIAELKLYQRATLKKSDAALPDLLVIAIDANCASYTEARKQISEALLEEFRDLTVYACPDPHIERWYMADLEGFHKAVGITPPLPKQKCGRDVWKAALAKAVIDAGHPPTLGGIEFARELVEAMDFFRAGKSDQPLKHFLEETRMRLTQA